MAKEKEGFTRGFIDVSDNFGQISADVVSAVKETVNGHEYIDLTLNNQSAIRIETKFISKEGRKGIASVQVKHGNYEMTGRIILM